jgi:hypothetical protein
MDEPMRPTRAHSAAMDQPAWAVRRRAPGEPANRVIHRGSPSLPTVKGEDARRSAQEGRQGRSEAHPATPVAETASCAPTVRS